MRASAANRVPLIRMTNINLEPGSHSFDRLIGEVDEGVFLATNRSWSIDDRRLNFHFATEAGWEIKDGTTRAAAARLLVHRAHAAVLEFVRRRGRARRVAPVRRHELRQGRAGAGQPRGPRGVSGPLPRRSCGAGPMRALLGRDTALERARMAIAAALRAGADQAEVVIQTEDSGLTRYAGGRVHQHVTGSDAEVQVRAVVGRRVAVASGNQTSPDALATLAERATAIARHCAEEPDFAGLPAPTGGLYVDQTTWYEATADVGPAERVAVVGEILDVLAEGGATGYGAGDQRRDRTRRRQQPRSARLSGLHRRMGVGDRRARGCEPAIDCSRPRWQAARSGQRPRVPPRAAATAPRYASRPATHRPAPAIGRRSTRTRQPSPR